MEFKFNYDLGNGYQIGTRNHFFKVASEVSREKLSYYAGQIPAFILWCDSYVITGYDPEELIAEWKKNEACHFEIHSIDKWEQNNDCEDTSAVPEAIDEVIQTDNCED